MWVGADHEGVTAEENFRCWEGNPCVACAGAAFVMENEFVSVFVHDGFAAETDGTALGLAVV